jgi:DNA-binding MarR family transcriptional regulator
MENSDKNMEVVGLIKEVLVKMRQFMNKAFESRGVTAPQGYLLGILSKNGKMKIHELSQKLSMTDSTVSGIIDRLEKQGMVLRVRSLEDKRVVYVDISADFQQEFCNFHEMAEINIGNLVKQGTKEELEQIVDGFTTLRGFLDKTQKIDLLLQ